MNKFKSKGSALILTLLMVSVIATLAFAVSALTISESRKATALTDSIGAYYAAESGLEQGLLQYRLWHDSQLSKDYYQAFHTGGDLEKTTPTEKSQGQPYRLDDPKGILPNFVGPNETQPADIPGNTWYELTMWYQGNKIGPDSRIFRDSALQLTIPTTAKKINIEWHPEGANTTVRPDTGACFLELVFTGSGSRRETIPQPPAGRCNGEDFSNELNINQARGENTVRIKAWDMAAARYSLAFDGCRNQASCQFDTQVTHIESTGHVGRTKRKLELHVNRSSGTGLESGDFLILTGDRPLFLP